MTQIDVQTRIDALNQDFWDELCGSNLAQHLGLKDHSMTSLQTFDNAYMGFYPYLLNHVKVNEMKGKQVLEVGLGYGTLGQIIAQAGSIYTGLDIAESPVKMMNHRLKMQDIPGHAIQGSMLECPVASGTMDWVVSIGCFHHTGDMQRCVDETYRVLKPGGRAMIMVYNRFSLRQWKQWPSETWHAFLHDLGILSSSTQSKEEQRKAYDATGAGVAAPETEFFSKKQINKIFKNFSKVKCHLENSDDVLVRLPFSKKNKLIATRMKALSTVGKLLGLDIYIEAYK